MKQNRNHRALLTGLSILLLQLSLRESEGAASYTLTIDIVGSGTVLRDPTNSIYPAGATVTLTAFSNDPTWYFSSWSGDATGTANPLDIQMLSNKVITATFQQLGSTNVVQVCTEEALRAAIALGGWVSINCSGTFTLCDTIDITNQVILDAHNESVVISGNDAVRLFYVAPGASLTATNLTFANGSVTNNPADGGGIYNDGGTVVLVSCVLTNNNAQVQLGDPFNTYVMRGGLFSIKAGRSHYLGVASPTIRPQPGA